MDDDSILALLADTDTPRQVPAHQVWSDSALVDAWSAAIHEFASSAYADSPIVLDREAQLLASPLWYAPQCSAQASTSTSTSSAKRAREGDEQEEDVGDEEELNDGEEYEYDEEEYNDEGGEPQHETTITQSITIGPVKPAHSHPRPRPSPSSFIHPSRLDHHKNHSFKLKQTSDSDPYFDISEWQPVSSTSQGTQHVTIPDPPPLENAPIQDGAITASQPSQEALEKALQAWYTAGYAAALYHVRSGLVKP